MDLKHLRYFLILAEELHFGRAAERLMVGQPVLARSVQDLETELGHPLLVREAGRLTLSDGGRSFLDGARRMLGEDPLVTSKGVVTRAPGNTLRIGQLASATSRIVPFVIA